MNIKIQVAGGSADRFRLYAVGPATRKPTADDHIKAALNKQKFRKGARVKFDAEHVVGEGGVSGKLVTVSLGSGKLTRIAFYKGDVESESVVGSVEFAGGVARQARPAPGGKTVLVDVGTMPASGAVVFELEPDPQDETDGLEEIGGDEEE